MAASAAPNAKRPGLNTELLRHRLRVEKEALGLIFLSHHVIPVNTRSASLHCGMGRTLGFAQPACEPLNGRGQLPFFGLGRTLSCQGFADKLKPLFSAVRVVEWIGLYVLKGRANEVEPVLLVIRERPKRATASANPLRVPGVFGEQAQQPRQDRITRTCPWPAHT